MNNSTRAALGALRAAGALACFAPGAGAQTPDVGLTPDPTAPLVLPPRISDQQIEYHVLVEQLENPSTGWSNNFRDEGLAWVGTDYDKFLQPRAERNVYSKHDPGRGVGSGMDELDAGLRLRYEITRNFAPYIGLAYTRAFGPTATYARQEGSPVNDLRFVFGVRAWF